jgi:hypothetical protein
LGSRVGGVGRAGGTVTLGSDPTGGVPAVCAIAELMPSSATTSTPALDRVMLMISPVVDCYRHSMDQGPAMRTQYWRNDP